MTSYSGGSVVPAALSDVDPEVAATHKSFLIPHVMGGAVNLSHSPDYRRLNAELRKEGNKHFTSKNYSAAIQCYSEAIAIDGMNHVLYGNRSAAHAGNGEWEMAVADARSCVELSPGYTKGYYRLAQALLGMGDTVNAAAAIKSGLLGDPANKDMLRLAKRVQASTGQSSSGQEETVEKTYGRTRRKRTSNGDGAGRGGLEKLSLYYDKEGPEQVAEQGGPDGDALVLRKIFRSLRDSVGAPGSALGAAGRPHELEGVFRQLTNPEAFRRIVTAGLSEDERDSVPRTFQELLRSPLYSRAIEESLPRVVANAASVLEGVKERGRKTGDVMDAATAEALRPQVLQEAFARAVVGVVSAVHTEAKAKAALEKGQLASPNSKQASWDQLEQPIVEGLMTVGRGFAVQDAFLCGDEWESVFLNDCVRFAEAGKLSPEPTGARHGEVAWVEPNSALESTFPALHELLASLHALTYELNRKTPGLRLARPLRGSTMLLRLRAGCRLPATLDSRANGIETGHKISCVYFVGHTSSEDPDNNGVHENDGGGVMKAGVEGGQLKLQNVEIAPAAEGVGLISAVGARGAQKSSSGLPGSNAPGNAQGRDGGQHQTLDVSDEFRAQRISAQGTVVEPARDRLVLYRSDCVLNEILEVKGQGRAQYVVRIWMHGAKPEGVGGSDHESRHGEPSGNR